MISDLQRMREYLNQSHPGFFVSRTYSVAHRQLISINGSLVCGDPQGQGLKVDKTSFIGWVDVVVDHDKPRRTTVVQIHDIHIVMPNENSMCEANQC